VIELIKSFEEGAVSWENLTLSGALESTTIYFRILVWPTRTIPLRIYVKPMEGYALVRLPIFEEELEGNMIQVVGTVFPTGQLCRNANLLNEHK
jgi:hypothetical protein